MLISIVIPVYNSSSSLEQLLFEINESLCGHSFEIIFVDDSSPDSSFEVLKNIRSVFDNITVIRLSKNYGQQNALLCGIRHSRGKYIVTMDDDLQHDPSYIMPMLSQIKKGYDCVYAASKVQMQSFYRRLGSKLTGLFFRIALGLPNGMKVSSFRMLTRDTAVSISRCTESFVYISAVTLRQTKKISCIDVSHRQRLHGSSNYSFKKLLLLFAKLALHYIDMQPFKFIKHHISNSEQYKIKELLQSQNADGFYAEKSQEQRVV